MQPSYQSQPQGYTSWSSWSSWESPPFGAPTYDSGSSTSMNYDNMNGGGGCGGSNSGFDSGFGGMGSSNGGYGMSNGGYGSTSGGCSGRRRRSVREEKGPCCMLIG